MKWLQIIFLYCLLLILISCGTNKFTARKYTKGYFVDNPAKVLLPKKNATVLTVNNILSPSALDYISQKKKTILTKSDHCSNFISINLTRGNVYLSEYHKSNLDFSVKRIAPSPASYLISKINSHREIQDTARDEEIAKGKHSILAGIYFSFSLALFTIAVVVPAIGVLAYIVSILATAATLALIISVINAFKSVIRHEKYFGIGLGILLLLGIFIIALIVLILFIGLFVGPGP